MNISNRQLLIIFVSISFCCIWWLSIFIDNSEPNCWSESVIERTFQIVSSNTRFEWAQHDAYMKEANGSIHLIASKEKLFFYGTLEKCATTNLIMMNANNGEFIEKMVGLGLPPISFINYDANSLYLGYRSTGKMTTDYQIGAGGVANYNVQSETVIWNQSIPGSISPESLATNQGRLVVDGSPASSHLYILDSFRGNVVTQLELDTSYPEAALSYAFLQSQILIEEGYYENTNGTQQISFWADQFQSVEYPPLQVDDILLIRTDGYAEGGSVKALDARTGEQLWTTNKNVISNIAIGSEKAFFLTNSATLIGANIETGEQTEIVQFTSGDVNISEDRGFYIAANENNQIFVYFGDSRQLFAFQFTPPPVTP